jgi:quinol monooxygenase YgiN
MPFFVAVHHQVHPGRREQRVETVRTDFAASPVSHPGRRFARLFEHLTDRTRLLAMEEWQSPADFERHQRSPGYVEAIEASGLAPTFDVLERVQHYRHMPHSPSALACTAISMAPDRATEVEELICDEERRDALVAGGLVPRAVYRVVGSAGRLLVLHGWRSIDHLERYLGGSAVATAATLAARGATLDQFAGRMAAEYSWLEA